MSCLRELDINDIKELLKLSENEGEALIKNAYDEDMVKALLDVKPDLDTALKDAITKRSK
jgi:hypothetical protein